MVLKEATQKELELLQLWDQWVYALTEETNGETVHRQQELLIEHQREAGLDVPTIGSPFCLMFVAFVGGLERARHNSTAGSGKDWEATMKLMETLTPRQLYLVRCFLRGLCGSEAHKETERIQTDSQPSLGAVKELEAFILEDQDIADLLENERMKIGEQEAKNMVDGATERCEKAPDTPPELEIPHIAREIYLKGYGDALELQRDVLRERVSELQNMS